MKKIIAMAIASCFVAGAGAQSLYDGARLTDKDLNGTARFVGMGGAMGALGGDISTIGTNPAGIGIFRSNDVMTSFSFSAYGTESKYIDKTFNYNKNHWSFDNIGFVISSKIGNETALRYLNFGFNYKRSKSFYKNMSMQGMMGYYGDQAVSQVRQMAQQATDVVSANGNVDFGSKNVYTNSNVGWLGALAYQGFLTNERKDSEGLNLYEPVVPNNAFADFISNERGGIDQYDFNIAFNVSERAYFGVTIGAYNVDYKKYSNYDESYNPVPGFEPEGYGLGTWSGIKGSGVDFKFGTIIRPFDSSPFRIGLAIHTPIFYSLTYRTSAILNSDVYVRGVGNNMEERATEASQYPTSNFRLVDIYANNDREMKQDFNLRTPWRYNASLGYTIGSSFALGAEYEYEDYSTMKFKYPEGDEMSYENGTVKDYLKGVHTIRVGMEYKVIPEFAFRLGYNYITSAIDKEAIKWIPTNSIMTDTDFANKQSQSNYTLGIGYRAKSFYADLAYQFSTYKENFNLFYNEFKVSDGNWDLVLPPDTKVTNTRSQVLLTLGFRF